MPRDPVSDREVVRVLAQLQRVRRERPVIEREIKCAEAMLKRLKKDAEKAAPESKPPEAPKPLPDDAVALLKSCGACGRAVAFREKQGVE